MEKKSVKFMNWLLQYLFAGIFSISALLIAKSYLVTNYDLLISNVKPNDYDKIISFLDEEYVPHEVSFDQKRIRVPDYEISRLQVQLQRKLGIRLSEIELRGGY